MFSAIKCLKESCSFFFFFFFLCPFYDGKSILSTCRSTALLRGNEVIYSTSNRVLSSLFYLPSCVATKQSWIVKYRCKLWSYEAFHANTCCLKCFNSRWKVRYWPAFQARTFNICLQLRDKTFIAKLSSNIRRATSEFRSWVGLVCFKKLEYRLSSIFIYIRQEPHAYLHLH